MDRVSIIRFDNILKLLCSKRNVFVVIDKLSSEFIIRKFESDQKTINLIFDRIDYYQRSGMVKLSCKIISSWLFIKTRYLKRNTWILPYALSFILITVYISLRGCLLLNMILEFYFIHENIGACQFAWGIILSVRRFRQTSMYTRTWRRRRRWHQ